MIDKKSTTTMWQSFKSNGGADMAPGLKEAFHLVVSAHEAVRSPQEALANLPQETLVAGLDLTVSQQNRSKPTGPR